MADPLSLASGVAGLLSLGIQVTQSLIDFYSSFRDQTSDLAQIMQNLESLLTIFCTLDATLKTRQTRIDELDVLETIDNSMRRCNEAIKELQDECQKFQAEPTKALTTRIKLAGRKATYPFRKSTLQKLEEDIDEIRDNLSFALDALQLKSNTKLEEGMSELKSLLERIDAIHISSTIRTWLMAPDATSDHHIACEKHHTDTGLWFVEGQEFKDWLMKRNSFLWINGFAGSGKSVLCSTAIQSTVRQRQHRRDVGIAFFYFTFNDKSKMTASGMLRALLLQLSAQLEDGERDLQELHSAYTTGIPPIERLLSSLQKMILRFHDSYILLDALDESPRERQRNDVLSAVKAMRQWCLPGFHLLVTSRDELDIHQSLNPTYNEDIMMRNPETDKDIANFVSYQLSHDSKFQRWKARHQEIKDNLTKKSQGVFRYVECQLAALKRAKNRIQLDDCLRSLPRDLDGTYERILCNIEHIYAKDVQRILTILCIAKRPLTMQELIDAHAVDLTDPPHLDREGRSYGPDDLIDICLGLIEVAVIEGNNGEKSPVARIAHFSVQEYLESDHVLQREAKEFAIQTDLANVRIAQICLVYLLEPELSDGPLDEARLAEFPLAHFAAMHWFTHYKAACGTRSEADALIVKLLVEEDRAFRRWIQLHDPDNPWREDVDFDRKNIPSPVYYAALLGLEQVFNSLVQRWKGETGTKDVINAQGGRFGNALQAASYGGHEKVMQLLLDRGAEVNAQGGDLGNALQAASCGGHEKVVQLLLDQGAEVNAQGGDFGNALQAASYGGHEKVVQLLLGQGAEVNAQGGHFGNALQAASCGGQEKVVQLLLDQGAEVNAQGGWYGNALQAASYRGQEKVMQLLLDRGAEVNAQGGRYGNALQAASYGGHEKVMQLLLDQGATYGVRV
ncbi:hypothetical protein BJX62DRAFT_253118 [Aspergillus germanicus]